LVLLPVVVGTIWFLPPVGTTGLACVAAGLAFSEYRTIGRALGVSIHSAIAVSVILAVLMVALDVGPMALGSLTTELFLVSMIVVGAIAVASGEPGPLVLSNAAATMFAPVYIGLPLGALAAVRGYSLDDPGRVELLLLLGVIVVSDSAQYYTGRAFGRSALAPTISPKKTVEGAIGGVVFGTLAMVVGGRFVFTSPIWMLALLGAALVLLGIVGDLFESLLKRSAGVKDSSNLIPGHGGVLDRIDSWLFAAPVYYVFVKFVA